ncbi:hypothetical protein HCN44_001163 [Aphidius gifuensis]|uniref:Epoxide hydrolase n=1 Tax=Aphidius gifuensis TaxID=684658 RepID=A0A834XKI3_APHGI|nr:juvenile hormone epoxide hydrolase 1-like [Aphidius gifuensis]KAF7988590.1 hypothetical protein HCN44_001163 [Aphidius gifuensis]
MYKSTIFVVIIAIGLTCYVKIFDETDNSIPTLPDTYWGPADKKSNNDISIKPFKINISNDVISDLNERLDKTRKYIAPLENTAWTYGVSSEYFKNIISYWRNKYDWNKRQALLNKYSQFITTIQGLDIHFYHIKPTTTVYNGKKLKVIPLLLAHGWPGSVVEFQKIIPMLTTPKENVDFIFELIIPSLPGYGFSQGAVRPGLAHAEIAVIFKNLMTRLGFNKFYAQGGDWGSIIVRDMAALYPENVVGAHMNMCMANGLKATFWQFIGLLVPSLVVPKEHAHRVYPLKNHFLRIMEESGYMHLQATKPDTIGLALNESPVSMAVYILEKFSTWTNPEYRFKEDGGLLEKYTMDELLDNVMIYWITNSMTTSMRLYAETFNTNNWGKYDKYPITVPTACAAFIHEVSYSPESVVKFQHTNLIQFNHFDDGGHFAAFEVPHLLSDDIWKFIQKVENNVDK